MSDALLASRVDLERVGEESIDDAKADQLLASASGVVRRWCGNWSIVRATETLRGRWMPGLDTVVLRTLHLVSVSAVRVDGQSLDPEDYEWDVSGVIRGRTWLGHRRRAVEVDAVHGYSPVPPEVTIVTCALALRMHINAPNAESEQVPGWSASIGGGWLLDGEKDVLAPYRLRP